MEPRITERVLSLPVRRGSLTDNAVFGMALAVFVEVMLFAGFISAFVIVRGATPAGLWPPPDQPRLPIATTAVNTAMLIASGVVLALAQRAFSRRRAAALRLMGVAILLGGGFVIFQGVEWVRLLGRGLTLTSSQLGAFFYVIVGAHALHATAALVALAIFWRAMRAGRLSPAAFGAVQLFWYFVVLMWPVIYWQVYL